MKKITRTITVSTVLMPTDDGSTDLREIIDDKELLYLLRHGGQLTNTFNVKCVLTIQEFYELSKMKNRNKQVENDFLEVAGCVERGEE